MERIVSTQSFCFSLEDSLSLRGNIHTIEDNKEKQVVILCHGFKGFKDWGFFPYAANYLAEKGYYVIRFNFSCNGVNEFDFDELDKFSINTYSREQADLNSLLQRIKAGNLPFYEQYNPDHISLIGHSRGGGNSLIFASEHPEISKVITWNGIANVDLFDDRLKSEIREKGIAFIQNVRTKQDMPIRSIVLEDMEANQERFNIVERAARLNIPVLLIQGAEDSPRLVNGARKLKGAAPQHSLIMIAGANHTFGAVHPFQGSTPHLDRALSETLSFLQQTH